MIDAIQHRLGIRSGPAGVLSLMIRWENGNPDYDLIPSRRFDCRKGLQTDSDKSAFITCCIYTVLASSPLERNPASLSKPSDSLTFWGYCPERSLLFTSPEKRFFLQTKRGLAPYTFNPSCEFCLKKQRIPPPGHVALFLALRICACRKVCNFLLAQIL